MINFKQLDIMEAGGLLYLYIFIKREQKQVSDTNGKNIRFLLSFSINYKINFGHLIKYCNLIKY